MIRGLLMGLWLATCGWSAYGQLPACIRQDLNVIENGVVGVQTFYRRLEALEEGRRTQVKVLHIGDSHVQADWFSGRLRMELQRRFGNAGRGLVFPFELAQTNGPSDLRSGSTALWESNRILFASRNPKAGISGMAIRTRQADYALKLALSDNAFGLDYSFDRIIFFHQKGPGQLGFSLSENEASETWVSENISYHTVTQGEDLAGIASRYGCQPEQLLDWNGLNAPEVFPGQRLAVRREPRRIPRPGQRHPLEYLVIDTPIDPQGQQVSTILLNKKVKSLSLEGKGDGGEAILYGFSLESSDSRGILYHTVGINGAQFRHYNASRIFWDQIRELEPDLVIVSLGTNEAYDPYFQVGRFYEEVDQFVIHLQQCLPMSDVLLTTPPDSYRGGSQVNTLVHGARDVLLGYAVNHRLGCWNIYDIMGGEGSVQAWYQAGLALRDRLHFSRQGYELQGKLLFEALIQGYAAFRSTRSR